MDDLEEAAIKIAKDMVDVAFHKTDFRVYSRNNMWTIHRIGGLTTKLSTAFRIFVDGETIKIQQLLQRFSLDSASIIEEKQYALVDKNYPDIIAAYVYGRIMGES